jgi:hypothetical protein
MKNIDFDTLENIAYQVDGETYANYSGRAMYGKSCAGIVLDESDLIKLGAVIFELVEDEELRYELLSNYSLDNLGQRVIAYWRGVTCEDAPEEEE